MRKPSRYLKLWVRRLVAVAMIALGAVLFPMPVPLGLVFLTLGLALLLASSRTLTLKLKELRQRYPRINIKLNWAEARLPRFCRRALRKSAPDYGHKSQGAKQFQPSPNKDKHLNRNALPQLAIADSR